MPAAPFAPRPVRRRGAFGRRLGSRPGGPGSPAARAAGAVPALLVTATMLLALAGVGALGRGAWTQGRDAEAGGPPAERVRFAAAARDAVPADRTAASAPAPRRAPAGAAPVAGGAAGAPGGATAFGAPGAPGPWTAEASRPAGAARALGTVGGGPWARRDVTPLRRGPTPGAAPAWAGRLGDERRSAAVADPIAPGQADSALQAARADLGRLRDGPGWADARAGRALAGRVSTELTAADRAAMARAVMADEAERSRPAVGIPIPGGLPGGGPSAHRRARDRAVHAATLEMIARVEARARHRADSVTWAAESTREAARAAAAKASPNALPPSR